MKKSMTVRYTVLIGYAIRDLREQKGLNQKELAQRCDMQVSKLSRLESGATQVNVETLSVLAEALGTNVSEIFCMADEYQTTLKAQGIETVTEPKRDMKKTGLIAGAALLGGVALAGIIKALQDDDDSK